MKIHSHQSHRSMKVSLSDRFGLWLGFHNCDQAAYFKMIERYVEALHIPASEAEWLPLARNGRYARGASGRIAWQFIRFGRPL